MADSSTSLSFANLAAVYGTITASSAATGWPASNLALANRYLPWRSTGTTQQEIVIDLGAARTVDRIALIDTNVTQFRVEQNATNVWTSPAYVSSPQAIGRDPDRRAYRRWFERAPHTPLTLRYTRIVIPAQIPNDGAAYFRMGTLWMGTFVGLPTDPRVAYQQGVTTPKLREEFSLSRAAVEYKSGDSFARQSYTRFAEMALGTPGVGDDWGAWLDIDRQIEDAPGMAFCYLVDYWGGPVAPSGVWIMRQTNQTDWRASWPVAEDAWDLEEVVA